MIICDNKTYNTCKKKKYSCRGCEYYVNDEIRKRAIRLAKRNYTNLQILQNNAKKILTDKSSNTKYKKIEFRNEIELDLRAYDLIIKMLSLEATNEFK